MDETLDVIFVKNPTDRVLRPMFNNKEYVFKPGQERGLQRGGGMVIAKQIVQEVINGMEGFQPKHLEDPSVLSKVYAQVVFEADSDPDPLTQDEEEQNPGIVVDVPRRSAKSAIAKKPMKLPGADAAKAVVRGKGKGKSALDSELSTAKAQQAADSADEADATEGEQIPQDGFGGINQQDSTEE